MSDRAALLAAVAARPDDDLPKLVFADWLDEHGDPDRAEFVRLSVAYYREAVAHPPATDPAKARRMEELFAAHYRTWLKPIYDAVGQPVPDVRKDVGSQGGIALTTIDRPLVSCVLHAGFVGMLTLSVGSLPSNADLPAAFAAEPINTLSLMLSADVAAWERLNGPHLRQVYSLTANLARVDYPSPDDPDAVPHPLADAVFGSEHLTGLRSLMIGGRSGERAGGYADAFFAALRRSPVRRQLTSLSLLSVPHLGRFLARPDGFENVRKLVAKPGSTPAAADELFARDIDDGFRERLTRLVIDTSPVYRLGWLTAGRPWEHLDTLFLTGNGVGDVGATQLAGADTLPALRELRVQNVQIGDAGAIALARAPWVANLKALYLDHNPIGDDGLIELALALDRGLGYLSVQNARSPVSVATRRALIAKYGLRVNLGEAG